MRKLSVLTACFIGTFCLAASPIMAAEHQTRSLPTRQWTPAALPSNPLVFLSRSEGGPVCEVDPEIPGCYDKWDCTAYCEDVFTGGILQVVCLAGCCECQDVS